MHFVKNSNFSQGGRVLMLVSEFYKIGGRLGFANDGHELFANQKKSFKKGRFRLESAFLSIILPLFLQQDPSYP